MGYVFEELIRIGAEQADEEAGEHFTPREVIELMVALLLSPEPDLGRSHVVKTIYDPACGTGGCCRWPRGTCAITREVPARSQQPSQADPVRAGPQRRGLGGVQVRHADQRRERRQRHPRRYFHPRRLPYRKARSSFAALCGTSPVEASSGRGVLGSRCPAPSPTKTGICRVWGVGGGPSISLSKASEAGRGIHRMFCLCSLCAVPILRV